MVWYVIAKLWLFGGVIGFGSMVCWCVCSLVLLGLFWVVGLIVVCLSVTCWSRLFSMLVLLGD